MNYVKTMALLATLTAVFLSVGWLMGGVTGMLIAFVIAIGTNFYAFWNSDKAALRMHGARRVTRAEAPEFVDMVEDLVKRADMPMPAVYIIETDQPNAFATGRDPSNAAVAATTGLMRMLNRDELAGVMAHELAHIQNRDTLIMTVAATVAGAISMLAQFGLFFRGGRDRGAFGIIGVIAAAVLARVAAMMIQSLISRTREYSADRLGGEISGNPMALASALSKISNTPIQMETAERNPASAHLFIVNPLAGLRMDRLFSTHPPAERRIAELKRQAGQTGQMRQARQTGRTAGWNENPVRRSRRLSDPFGQSIADQNTARQNTARQNTARQNTARPARNPWGGSTNAHPDKAQPPGQEERQQKPKRNPWGKSSKRNPWE